MKRVVAAILMLAVIATLCWAETTTKTFGKAPTIKEATPISKLTGDPKSYADKNILVSGKIMDMCRHSGCWVEIMAPDSSRVICKSLDESIHFTKECIGQQVQLQGKAMFDSKAKDKVEMKSEGGEAPHACPAPKLLVSIEGATVELAAAESKTETKTEAKPETPSDHK